MWLYFVNKRSQRSESHFLQEFTDHIGGLSFNIILIFTQSFWLVWKWATHLYLNINTVSNARSTLKHNWPLKLLFLFSAFHHRVRPIYFASSWPKCYYWLADECLLTFSIFHKNKPTFIYLLLCQNYVFKKVLVTVPKILRVLGLDFSNATQGK